jgi:CheY-like chemotaxis protein
LGSNSPNKKRIRFEISDSGIGIPKEKFEEIFQPFTPRENIYDGIESIGLGLAITKKLIELFGGKLDLQSEVGKGTTISFELDFEIAEKKASNKKVAEEKIIGYSDKTKTILVVDDNSTNLKMLVSILEPLGFNILTAGNGDKVVDRLSSSHVDLILLDLLMPVLDGIEVVNKIKSDENIIHPKVIGISAAIADRERMEKFSSICDDTLAKPIDVELLLQKIKDQLDLHWLVESELQNSKTNNNSTSTSGIDRPEKEILEKIILKVNLGDFTGVNTIVTELSANGNYYQFCNEVQKLAKKFDEESIIKLCMN